MGAFEQVCTDALRDSLTLGDEFGGVKLGDDSFEDFVTDRRKDTFIVVLAEILISSFSLFSYGVVYDQVLCCLIWRFKQECLANPPSQLV